MKIPFNIKYKSQIESGEYKVKTKSEQEVRIVCWDMNTSNGVLLVALVKGYGGEYEKMRSYTLEGKCKSASDEASLYIHTPEPELTEFEKAYSIMRYGSEATAFFKEESINKIKKDAATLLEYARRQFERDLPKWKHADWIFTDNYYLTDCDDEPIVAKGHLYLILSELDKLPKED